MEQPGGPSPRGRCGGDRTASADRALLAEIQLANSVGPLPHPARNWNSENPDPGLFDLMIGSDLLRGRQQPAQLARLVQRHAETGTEVIIVDPDRGNRGPFCGKMAASGPGPTMAPASQRPEYGEAHR